MVHVEVFDPPMCCSTGVCGPSVDPALSTFAADLSSLSERNVKVTRHNLSQEPRAFVENTLVRKLLAEHSDAVLPVVFVNGEFRSSTRYPSIDELETWSELSDESALDEVTSELVALGAAVASNCESCFTFHHARARALGVSKSTMAAAVRVAQSVKDAAAASMTESAATLLATSPESLSRTTSDVTTSKRAVTAFDKVESATEPCCTPSDTTADAAVTLSAKPCCSDDVIELVGATTATSCCD